ncbi:ATP-binding protein [Streptomyces sp. MNU89]|uniref:ATP-binding protein n=1 Tax=Streptomyces sp. MNU89 TaxID=2560025 RepID=UPI001E475D47|nr:ATP-binding protein [Streptomyces sp. MNU89]MCC9742273.1 ATP-binding protein [Streptomyces sp. MNU89]
MSPALGWYPAVTPAGFVLHLSATPRHLSATRRLVEKTLCGAGVDADLTDSVQLVLSELYGNAVRACGDFVPLVAEVEVEAAPGMGAGAPSAVWVRLHDPYRAARPRRTGVRLDDPEAESGRGLPIVDLLAPGWDVTATPVGKQVRCRVPVPGR